MNKLTCSIPATRIICSISQSGHPIYSKWVVYICVYMCTNGYMRCMGLHFAGSNLAK